MFFTARAFTTEGVSIAIRRVGAATPMGTRSGTQEQSECRCRRVVAAPEGCAAMVAETICDICIHGEANIQVQQEYSPFESGIPNVIA
jgi:lactam utilization protein B